jgi:hypothetical protein
MKDRPIRVMLRVYKYERTLEEEFSSFYDAENTIELMHKSDPDLIIQPYVQLSDNCEIEISELAKN